MAIIYGKRERLLLLLLLLHSTLLQAPLCTSCSQRQSRAINEFKLENLLDAAKLLKAADRQQQERAWQLPQARHARAKGKDATCGCLLRPISIQTGGNGFRVQLRYRLGLAREDRGGRGEIADCLLLE